MTINDSILIDRGLKLFYWAKRSVWGFIRTSKCVAMLRRAKGLVAFNLLNNLGTILLIAVMTNIILSLLLSKESGFIPWFMRINLMLVGIIWISCRVKLNDIKETSLCFRLIAKRLK